MLRIALLALGVTIATASAAPAQYYCAPGFGGGFAYRSGYGISIGGRGFRFSAYSRGFYAAPILPIYYSYGWVSPYGPGYGPGFGNPFFLPAPPFALPEPAIVLPVANNVPVNPPVEPPAPVIKGEFIVIAPRKRDGEGTISPVVDRVAARPTKPPPVFRFDPFAEQRMVGLTEPAAAGEAAFQVNRARESLARGEYGAAGEQLDRALRAAPDDASAAFLKSQAQFAAGQYAEAVATIQTGLKSHPAWATLPLNAPELFGTPDRFEALMRDLERTRGARPGSAPLQFLLAHQMWFSGRRDEAVPLFRGLADRLADTSATAPFLKR